MSGRCRELAVITAGGDPEAALFGLAVITAGGDPEAALFGLAVITA